MKSPILTLLILLCALCVHSHAAPYATYNGDVNQQPADPETQGWVISGGLNQGVEDGETLGWELNDNSNDANPTMHADYGISHIPDLGDAWTYSVNARLIYGNGSATNVIMWSNGTIRYLFFPYVDATGNIDIQYFNSAGSSATLQNHAVNDNGYHTWAIVHDGTNTKLTYDGADVVALGSIAASGTARGIHVGGGSSSGQGAIRVASATFDATLANGPSTTTLGRAFGDHMVLQRGEPAAVFGNDSINPGTQNIQVQFAGQTKTTTTDANGNWRVNLDAMTANATGRDLVVTGSASITITDILVGEVWLATGQSNMNATVSTSSDVNTPNPSHFPLIRMCNWEGSVGAGGGTVYNAGNFANLTPENFFNGSWQTMDTSTVLPQSAVAYYFAQNLAADLNVPIGIIDISYGGTSTEAYISPAAHANDPHLKDAFQRPHLCRNLGQWTGPRIYKNIYNNNVNGGNYIHSDPAKPHPHPLAPGFLFYTGMTHLTDFTFKGALWYQGESNVEFTTGKYQINGNRLSDYQTFVMKTMIADWRNNFAKPAFPVYMVQLPRINAANRALWPYYREAQQRVASDIDGVELATIMEFGVNGSNVHPHDKQPVGERLASIAKAKLYGENIVHGGPTYKSHQVAGNKITLKFNHIGSGLTDQDGGSLRNFLIAGKDRNFVTATATIVGDTIEVTSPSVTEPVAVRHAWHMNADVDLFNTDGFSSSSFRTDKWIIAPGRKIKVACIGDSITFGFGISNATDKYPAQLERFLGTTNFEVRNFGKSGSGIYRQANKYDNSTEYTNALAYQPDIVICNLGINDITEWGNFTQEQFETEYFSLVDAFTQSGNQPLFIQWNKLAPLYPGQAFYGDPNLDSLNSWIQQAAANTNSILLDMETPLSGNETLMSSDHIHPTAAGALEIAETTFCLLDSIGYLDTNLTISEFLAINTTGLQDENGESKDWIELYNSGTGGACLSNLYLTNQQPNPTLWKIPESFVLAPGEKTIIFASAKNRTNNNAELHTNFELSNTGGYLALIDSDGTTIIDSYNHYPLQHPNISYGRTGAPTTNIPINNPGFEQYESGAGTTNAQASNWSITDIADVTYGPLRQAWTSVAAEGTYSYLVNATDISQVLTTNLAANHTYSLRVGMHKGTSGTAVRKYDVTLKAGSNIIATMDNSADLNNGSIGYRELTFISSDSTLGIGSPIEIVLRSAGGIYIGFDDVSLTSTSAIPQNSTPLFFNTPTPQANNSASGTPPFAIWKSTYGISTDTSDNDSDGLNAFMEFATGTNPNSAISNAQPTAKLIDESGMTYLTTTFQIANGLSGLTYDLEYSADIGETPWITETNPVLISSLDNGDGTSSLTYRLPTANGNQTKNFTRVTYNYSE